MDKARTPGLMESDVALRRSAQALVTQDQLIGDGVDIGLQGAQLRRLPLLNGGELVALAFELFTLATLALNARLRFGKAFIMAREKPVHDSFFSNAQRTSARPPA